MSRIACPYCCTIQTFPDGQVCKNCNETVPENYLTAARVNSPFYMAVVGMSSHGKTTLIHSLINTIDHLGKISRGAFLTALDDHTATELKLIRQRISKREANNATTLRPKGVYLQTPMVLSLKSFMTDNRHTLVIYDIAGEAFSDRAEIQQYAEPLKLAHTIWFIVSQHDLTHANSEYSTLADLFNIYVTGMERAGANPRGRNLHLVYTKADKITNQLPNEVLEYIRNDPYSNLAGQSPRDLKDKQFNETSYVAELNTNSEHLLEYTRYDVDSGIAFINMAEDYEMALSFSVNTALGGDHTPNRSQIEYESLRVLDPLIWALQDNVGLRPGRNGQTSEIVLILDTGYNSKRKIYEQKLPSHFFTALSQHGDVKTYYIGTMAPMIQSGIEPSNAAPDNETQPYIGMILDQLREGTQVVVLTCQRIGDLLDFHTSEWHQRLSIITFDQRPYEVQRNDPWPRSVDFDVSKTPASQVEKIIKRLFEKTHG